MRAHLVRSLPRALVMGFVAFGVLYVALGDPLGALFFGVTFAGAAMVGVADQWQRFMAEGGDVISEDLADGQRWRDEYGRVHVVHGVVGDGESVSSKPAIARAQKTGPRMALLSREGMEPHIFDWIGEEVLRRDFTREHDS